jgi:hypothetical protein
MGHYEMSAVVAYLAIAVLAGCGVVITLYGWRASRQAGKPERREHFRRVD